jgi:CRP-like cAMP-binding protein
MSRHEVLVADPELCRGLNTIEVREARVRCTAPRLHLDPSTWARGQTEAWVRGDALFLILDGFALRRATHSGQHAVEVLGEGDVLSTITAEASQHEVRVLTRTTLAHLDRRFMENAARWPEVGFNLADRATRRARELAVPLALMHLQRLDERVHLMLWHLAVRWGKVTVDGVWIPFRLSHQDLADIVGARRPSITAAMRVLQNAGTLFESATGRLIVQEPAAG